MSNKNFHIDLLTYQIFSLDSDNVQSRIEPNYSSQIGSFDPASLNRAQEREKGRCPYIFQNTIIGQNWNEPTRRNTFMLFFLQTIICWLYRRHTGSWILKTFYNRVTPPFSCQRSLSSLSYIGWKINKNILSDHSAILSHATLFVHQMLFSQNNEPSWF